MRSFAGGRNVMLVTGEGLMPPAPRLHWIFSTALSEHEFKQIHPTLDRGLADPPRLIYAGRLSPEKGLACLIQALGVLKNEGFVRLPKLTIAGEGPERRALEQLCRSVGCETEVRFIGQLARTELSERFQEADICVQPSLTEGFSKAWLDAMAHGVPVLASDVGAARAVIGGDGERGWLVRPGEVNELAAALRRVLVSCMDWPALRHRCRAYSATRTLEVWKREIARICAECWECSIVDNKLTLTA
jgi:glycosyltransferase involved in cell wall biosynthesis